MCKISLVFNWCVVGCGIFVVAAVVVTITVEKSEVGVKIVRWIVVIVVVLVVFLLLNCCRKE